MDHISPQTFNCVGEVKENSEAAVSHAAPLIADLFCSPRSHIARYEIAETRIFAL